MIMCNSQKKYVSNFTSSTTNKGVEAKEIEVCQTRLDMNASSGTPLPAESASLDERAARSAEGASPPTPDYATGSYLQVVVEKHRRRQPEPTSPRLPSASSPLPSNQVGGAGGAVGAGGGGDVLVLPRGAGVVLACPSCGVGAAPPALAYYVSGGGENYEQNHSTSGQCPPQQVKIQRPEIPELDARTNKSWKIFGDMDGEKLHDDDGPDRVEVYYFERSGGSWLSTRSGAPLTACERAARRPARVSAALLAELLAAPRLLLAAPVLVLLHMQRCMLMSARGAVGGAVQTASDYALKPALALAFNALVQPLLVFAGNVCVGVREALRPLAQALGEAAEPAARLLAAVRLVEVRVAPPPPCTRTCACGHIV